jgi:hypothetical protein
MSIVPFQIKMFLQLWRAVLRLRKSMVSQYKQSLFSLLSCHFLLYAVARVVDMSSWHPMAL